MAAEQPITPSRNKERLFLLLIMVVLLVLFVRLFYVLQDSFADVPKRLQDGTMVNLNGKNAAENFAQMLKKGYYFDDQKDINLIEGVLAESSASSIEKYDNIGELNKKRFDVIADQAYATGGQSFKQRVTVSREALGYTGVDSVRFEQEQKSPPSYPAVADIGMNGPSISGTVTDKHQSISGVLVKLQLVLPQDSIFSDEEADLTKTSTQKTAFFTATYIPDQAKKLHLQTLIAFARTDDGGNYTFKNLPEGRAFEVLPLQPNYQFGRMQGTEDLDDDAIFNFSRAPHTIHLLSTKDFNTLRKEKSLIIRMPEYFNFWYWVVVGGFFAGFIILHLVLTIKAPQADQLILPVMMLLTGISFLTLLSLQDPLRDRFFAKDSLVYLAIGFASVIIMLLLKMRRFTPDAGFYRLFVFKRNEKAANGWPWIASALLLLLLTIKFGTGPEGSGVKVNLFIFQPSEIVKYLVILFLAGFFAMNEKFISEYASWRKRWSFFSFALIAIGAALMLFLLLGDLGPAMVICFTFIILFSFSRGDFIQMALAVVFYVLITWAFKNVWISAGASILFLIGLWAANKRKISESAIMAVIVIAAFMTLDKVPHLAKLFPGPMQRLIERKAIWQDPWNNEVYGGDQVANGLWAMAGGGVTGQGLGRSYAKTIPEAHTDMILPSIGENFGWAGIVCIFIMFLLYLHRCIIIGRQTGTPFLFYLCAGVGICTFIQFLLIAGGSTGATPLSGVALPFESYGGSSLVANFIAAGFLLSVSNVKGTPVQMAYLSKQQDKNLVPALLGACVGLILLTVDLSGYLFHNEQWVVKPALVADKSGARMFSYNPRIAILMNKLQAGTIYDRKGVILATSDPKLIAKQKNKIAEAGAGDYDLDSAMHKRLTRYYPFQDQLFFWLGDANTMVFDGSTNGYFAEYEHAAELHGFKMPISNYTVKASRYQEDRFLPRGMKEMTVSKKDYSAIANLLIAGINSTAVDSFKNKNRDVQLSVDAQLQTSIERSMASDTSLYDNRVSVVVMESSTGDVLASTQYPLPPVKNWDLLTMSVPDQNKLAQWVTTSDLGFTYATQPGSTAKVLTAMAAFNKLGADAQKVVYPVYSYERIRTKGIEPDETGNITLESAIVHSNNVYFIKLANQQHLQEDMATLYMKTGMFLHGVGGYFYNKKADNTNGAQEEKWRELWRKTEFNTKPPYDPNNIHKTRAKGISGMAWGQGELIATPAAVARLASGVANNGTLMASRFALKVNDTVITPKISEQLTQPTYAALLKQYMIEQSAPKVPILGISVAGKTGTPERIWKGNSINDGWYVFFAPNPQNTGYVVACIRIESTKGSSDAVHLAGNHVIPFLLKMGYIKSMSPQPDSDNNDQQ
jgi:cell division protein FtsW (lipid II flippase)